MQLTSETDVAGKRLKFYVLSGVVVGANFQTHTWVGGANGNVTGGSYQSTGFAIRSDDGKEHPFYFTQYNFFVREGNRMSVIFVTSPKGTFSNHMMNHDSGQSGFFTQEAFVHTLGLVWRPKWMSVSNCIGLSMLAGIGLPLLPFILVQHLRARTIWKRDLAPKLSEIDSSLRTVASA